jgi:hypothetical protein
MAPKRRWCFCTRPASRNKMQAEIELLCTSKPQHLGCSTSIITPPLTCDPGRADRVNLPRVLSSHRGYSPLCQSASRVKLIRGSEAPVRPKTSGPHASAQHTANRSRFHRSLWRWAPCTTHPIWPNFHREMEERSTIRWQHRLKREHPTCTERSKKSLTKSADGRVATGLVGARRNGKKRKEQESRSDCPFPSWGNGDRAVLAVKGSLTPQRTRP